uniref:uncharacterized protein LOC120332196 n=1 Tax=Styela clava TaxID=7725 RepID=UPI001939726F|nr:uncharacterized protein LOC120332196 [Styela clava]
MSSPVNANDEVEGESKDFGVTPSTVGGEKEDKSNGVKTRTIMTNTSSLVPDQTTEKFEVEKIGQAKYSVQLTASSNNDSQTYQVHSFKEEEEVSTNINNCNNTKDTDSIFKRIKQIATRDLEMAESNPNPSRSKSILMCIPCRITFNDSCLLVSHGSTVHGVQLNKMEKELVECKFVNSIIQEPSDGKARICFLEPVDQQENPESVLEKDEKNHSETEKKGDDEGRHLEKISTLIVKGSIDVSEDSTISKSIPAASLHVDHGTTKLFDDVNMDENKKEDSEITTITHTNKDVTDSQAPQNQIDEKTENTCTVSETLDANESESQLKSSSEKEQKNTEIINSPPSTTSNFLGKYISVSEQTRILHPNRQIRTMATTSENITRTSPLSSAHNVKTPSSMSDNIFASSGGGVANIDPLFQMSLFQSRNSCKTLKCPRCNWHYKYRQTLDAHMREKHSEDTSDCLYCNANQPHPRLSRGESYACGYKPFKCEVCNYSTTTKGNLSIHMQSDKHLYNVKTIQHHQQQKDKINGQSGNASNQPGGSAIPARLLAEKQEQLQNLIQQARKRSSPDASASKRTILQRSPPKSRKGNREFNSSPTSTTNRRAMWRCEVCNYETDNNRNLRIHMQSEKHAHNVTSAGNATLKCLENLQNTSLPDSPTEESENNGADESLDIKSKESTSSANPLASLSGTDQNSPNPMTMYYYLAALQASMQGGQQSDLQAPSSPERDDGREMQQKQLIAQQQQLLLAQQYQQMLAQLSGQGGDSSTTTPNLLSNPSTALLQQQMLLQQQIQMWRQLLAQGDGSRASPGLPQLKTELDGSMPDLNNSGSTSTKFLFTCGICCNFSCNDLESLCSHVRTTRFPRDPMEKSEWVTKTPGDGYRCRICNYTTQLKTNFSLHCKTEKHTSKLQLINHIREGGEANEWKINYAIAGNNMNRVTCNGCRHSATSTDKLRIHCSTDRHQGTLTMCHYLDTMLKDAELGKGLHSTSEGISSHHLLCHPCAYQSKFVVEMIQHMQCPKHQVNVHQEQQRVGANLADMVSAEPDHTDGESLHSQNEEDNIKKETESNDDQQIGDKIDENTEEIQNHKCQFCNYKTTEENRLQIHIMTQHNARPAIKCPMCTEFMHDTLQFQLHLVQVHKLASGPLETKTENPTQSPERRSPTRTIGGTLEAIQLPLKVSGETMNTGGERIDSTQTSGSKVHTGSSIYEENNNPDKTFSEQCRQCGDTLTSQEKWQLHLEIHRIQASALASASLSTRNEKTCETCRMTFSSVNQFRQHLHTKHGQTWPRSDQQEDNENEHSRNIIDEDNPLSNARSLLNAICSDNEFATKAMKDPGFNRVWETLEAPFTCSPCEETFVSKNDLLDHIMASSVHMGRSESNEERNKSAVDADASAELNNQFPRDGATGNEQPINKENMDFEEENARETSDNEGKSGAQSSNFDFSLLHDYKWKRGRLLYPGISKSAHKKVLVDVGFNQVVHFVENRSSENREKAKKWKEQQKNQDGDENERKQQIPIDENENNFVVEKNMASKENVHVNHNTDKQTPDETEQKTSPFHCDSCGKDFSNMWILKVHEKSVHNMEMSTEMLQEFVEGYSNWYWDCARKDLENVNNTESDLKQFSSNNAAKSSSNNVDSTGMSPRLVPSSNLSAPNMSDISQIDDGKDFQHNALQALMKNYPGMLGAFGGANSTQDAHTQSAADDAQSKIQQQMLLQSLMTAQTQAMQQQQSTNQTQGSSQTNASNIMNMLVDHIYGAAMHGSTPGFIDPVGVMSLLQQQQQARVPAAGVNPYQWLAMRFMQQQQLQQLLMYPAMTGGAAGMPFLPSLAENANQQQMLASFAASLLNPNSSSPDLNNSVVNNPLSSALQAYQLQAAAAASMTGESRPGGKDAEQDPNKSTIVNQRESSNISHSPASAELPAKRPRTRITDDQLKILRANFDINTSPSENQISDMAHKTNLPSKVIKHWFRNTLFKERQRSKDSPYNFNIPPMTSLDDVKREPLSSSDNSSNENAIVEEKSQIVKVEPEQNEIEVEVSRENESHQMFTDSVDKREELHGATSSANAPIHSTMSQSQAMQILKSLTERGNLANTEANKSIFANAMSLVPNVTSVRDNHSPVGSTNYSLAADHRASSDSNDHNNTFAYRQETANSDAYSYERIANVSNADFSYPIGTPGHANLASTISRRTPRTRFSDYQLKILQEFFDKNAYPKDEDLDKLSRLLDLSTRVIVVWFQNARQKARKSYEMQQSGISAGHHTNGIQNQSNSYLTRRPSPPLSSSVDQQMSSMLSTQSLEMDLSPTAKHSHQFSHDVATRASVLQDMKRETRAGSPTEPNYKCNQCDATLPSAVALSQHERLHDMKPSAYIENVIQQYRMFYPSIVEGMLQGSSGKDSHEKFEIEAKNESRRPSNSPPAGFESERRKLSYSKESETVEMKPHIKQETGHGIEDIINRFSLPQPRGGVREKSHSYESKMNIPASNMISQNIMTAQQYITQRDNAMAAKRKLSVSPTLSMSSSSSTSPNSARQNMGRKVINDTSKDPKRLRTTITPEQLEFLYQQYLVDSSPSRKVIEQISDIVGLKKRVVQVWFQNTRARERKGQFRSVGRITSVLGMPQICPQCRVTFRTKADLDAHIRCRHMQSPSSIPTSSASQMMTSPTTSYPESKTTFGAISSSNSRLSASEISSASSTALFRLNETKREMSKKKFKIIKVSSVICKNQTHVTTLHGSTAGNPITSNAHAPFVNLTFSDSTPRDKINDSAEGHGSSPKRRKLSEENHSFDTTTFASKFVATPRTADIYKAVTEQISKSNSVDVIAQRLQAKTASLAPEVTENNVKSSEGFAFKVEDAIQMSSSPVMMSKQSMEGQMLSSPPVSSPESRPTDSLSPSFMVPLKRYRTQMSSLQVRSLKHCFSEYKTPTLLECEMLGQQIGLPKRVIQVWFQNARAKEKKAIGDQMDQNDQAEESLQMKSSCRLCPEMRFGSLQEYRNHVFSKIHLGNFMAAHDGEGSDDQSCSSGARTPSSDFDDSSSRDAMSSNVVGFENDRDNNQQFASISVPNDVAENKYRISAVATSDSTSSMLDTQTKSSHGWDASVLAANPVLLQSYQQLAAVQKLMNAGAVQNGMDKQKEVTDQVQVNSDILNTLKQNWLHRL